MGRAILALVGGEGAFCKGGCLRIAISRLTSNSLLPTWGFRLPAALLGHPGYAPYGSKCFWVVALPKPYYGPNPVCR